jgi:hypothetical protein
MPAFLVPVKPGLCVIPLEKAIVLIGRQSDCDVSLTQSRKVSRKHCCLAQVNNKIVVRDLGSTNGIFINGQRIKKEGRVKLGDVLTVGDLQFRLQTDPKPKPADSPLPPSGRTPFSGPSEVGRTIGLGDCGRSAEPRLSHHPAGRRPRLRRRSLFAEAAPGANAAAQRQRPAHSAAGSPALRL